MQLVTIISSSSFVTIIRRVSIALLLVVCLFSVIFPQTKPPDIGTTTLARINSYLNEIEKVGFSGAVLVERDGRVVVARRSGMRNAEKNIKNDQNGVFDIGSLTKQFTAAVILKLEMQGKLSTDDKIGKFFPKVPEDKAAITIHELLRHSSGLRSNVGRDYESITREDFIDKVMASKLESSVGERFRYSNIGYSLLAMIAEKASGKTYEEFLHEELFEPSGMSWTGYSKPKYQIDRIAVGYSRTGTIWGKPTEKAWNGKAPFWHLTGNGGLLSTTGDLHKWAVALRSDKILSAAAKQKLYHPKLRAGEDENPYYAYGWDVFKTRRNTYVARHNETNNIFYADMHHFLDERITIIHLSNKGIPALSDINSQLSRIIFDPDFIPLVPAAENEANLTFTRTLINAVLEKGVEAAFETSKLRPTGIEPIERSINAKGYDLIDEKKLTQAINLFIFNTRLFPRSANAFDSLGEAYMETGEKKLAIENYEKSLKLDPDNMHAERMLKRLQEP